MMEQARRAGAGFEVDLTHAAARMLGQLGRSAVQATRRSPRKIAKAKTKKRRLQVDKKTKKKKLSASRRNGSAQHGKKSRTEQPRRAQQ
jgi:hypothetical protein